MQEHHGTEKESREIKVAMQKTNPSPSQTLLGTTCFLGSVTGQQAAADSVKARG